MANLSEQVQSFWSAVAAQQASLCALEPPERMALFNRLLSADFPDISAEIEVGRPSGWQLVLTAGGATTAFEPLIALSHGAPPLEGFEVVAFRQRSDPHRIAIEMPGLRLDCNDVRVRHSPSHGRVDVAVGICKPIPAEMADHARNIVLLLMDHVLGEYDFAVKVGTVEFLADDADLSDCAPLADFAAALDNCWAGLGHTGVFPDTDDSWSLLRISHADDADDEGTILIQRNDAANALVGRADLGHRLDLATPVASSEELDIATGYEERMHGLLHRPDAGCLTHIELEDGVRTVSFQVMDPDTALAQAERMAEQMGVPVEAAVAYDPAWERYCGWLR